MMTILLLLAVATQYEIPPAPPSPYASAAVLERELDRVSQNLRTQCYSEKAIAIIVDDIRQANANSPAAVATIRDTTKELNDAAYAEPFDLERMIQAVQARAKVQADAEARRSIRSVAVLRKLPKDDRARHARTMSLAHPALPPKTCH